MGRGLNKFAGCSGSGREGNREHSFLGALGLEIVRYVGVFAHIFGEIQGRAAVAVADIKVGTGFDEDLDDFQEALAGGEMERVAADFGGDEVGVSALLEQLSDEVGFAFVGGAL